VKVSDHAVLRYCERFLDLDVCAIKRSLSKAVVGRENGAYLIADTGMYAVVQNNTIVTIVPRATYLKKPLEDAPRYYFGADDEIHSEDHGWGACPRVMMGKPIPPEYIEIGRVRRGGRILQ